MRHVAAYRAISTGLRHFGDRITAFEKSIAVFSPHIILHFNPLGIAMPTLAIALRYCHRNHVVSALYVSDNWLTGWPHIHPLHKLPPQVPLSKALIQPTRHGRVKRVRWREKRIRAQDFSFLLDPAERLFDLAFACSAYIKGISQSRLSSFTRMTVAPWGLPDVAEMEPLSAGAYRTSQSLNLVYIGQIEDHKGLLTVIETLPSIDARVNLTVLGDDRTAYASQCKAQAEQSGVADRVSFLGKVDHTTAIQAMKQWGQILIVPSLWAEPFSIVLLQDWRWEWQSLRVTPAAPKR
jgi:glycosyltransferase involved in cell wall biosynthesis